MTDDLELLFQYLLNCSKTGLQNLHLKRLNEAANLEKEMRTLMDAWVNARASAMLAELLRLHGEELTSGPSQLSMAASQESQNISPHAETASSLASLQPRKSRHRNRKAPDFQNVA